MQVSAKNQYAVRVHNLPEHEQVILRMIFAISQRSSARANSYAQATDPELPVDIVICGDDTTSEAGCSTPVLRVVDAMDHVSDAPVLLRPLIATRVLTVLDDVIAHLARNRQSSSTKSVVVNLRSVPPAQAAPVITDEAQSHVDNSAATELSASDGEAIAIAVDALLLADPCSDAEIHAEGTQSKNADQSAPPRARVLVVVDSAAERKQLEIELKHFAVDVDFAASARRAIEMIENSIYSLAFINAVLPEWDGFRICKSIKTRRPQTAVVMLLSQLATGDKLKGTLSGADGYLVKPVGRLTFQSLVQKYLPAQSGYQRLGA